MIFLSLFFVRQASFRDAYFRLLRFSNQLAFLWETLCSCLGLGFWYPIWPVNWVVLKSVFIFFLRFLSFSSSRFNFLNIV